MTNLADFKTNELLDEIKKRTKEKLKKMGMSESEIQLYIGAHTSGAAKEKDNCEQYNMSENNVYLDVDDYVEKTENDPDFVLDRIYKLALVCQEMDIHDLQLY